MDQAHDAQIAFLQKKLMEDQATFAKRRIENKRKAFITHLVVTAAGALTTVLLGLKGYKFLAGEEDYITALALVLSATVTFVSAWETFNNYKATWLLYTATLTKLFEIADDLGYAASRGEILQEELDLLHRRRQEALKENDSAWSGKREIANGAAGEAKPSP